MEEGIDVSKVKVDLGSEYNSALKTILDEIDTYRQQMLVSPGVIVNWNERLHALYMKLYPKMETKEIEKQISLRKEIAKIKLFYKKRYLEEGSVVEKKVMNRVDFIKLKNVLERREIHLNQIMERVGLTATEKKKGKRVR